jgi:type IV pilus assembly protein PilM
MATAIGIDLGTHSVKLCLMEGRPGKMERVAYELRAVPQDGDEPPTLERRLAALADLLAGLEKHPEGTWGAAYPSEAVSLRTVRLPFTDRGQIEKTIGFEVEGYVPFDLDGFIMDYRVVRQGDGRSQVIAALAEREALRGMLEGLSQSQVDPRHMMLDVEALAAVAGDAGCQLVVDVGHTRTLVALVLDGQLLDARAISFGGRTLTEALADKLGVHWGEAEGIKHVADLSAGPAADEVSIEWDEETEGRAPSADSREDAAAVLRRALGPLVADLRATLMVLEERQDLEIGEVILAGGTAGLGGLQRWLSGALSLPVRLALVSDEAERLGDPGRFALAHCLAVRASGGGRGQALDFRKDEFVFRGDLARVRQIAGVGATALAVFCLAALVMFGVRYQQLTGALATLDGQIGEEVVEAFPGVSPAAVSTSMGARAVVVEKTTEALERVESLGAIIGGEPPLLTMIKDLSQAMPGASEARVEVKELKVNEKSVQMKIETTGYEAAATIEAALKKRDQFAHAVRSDEKKKGEGISFTITIPLESAGEEEG